MKKTISIIYILIAIFSLSSCKKNKYNEYTYTFYQYFNTVINVYAYETSEEKFIENITKIDKLYSKYHNLFDIYYEYNGINNIRTVNKAAGKNSVVVDQAIIDLLLFSKEMYIKTNGYVNVAMGSVLKLWHDEREFASDNPSLAKIPDYSLLQEASRHTDINSIVIDKENCSVYISDKDASIDVGAVAKGYATELIAKELIQSGTEYYTINAGGNVRCLSTKADKSPWKIGIQNPNKAVGGNITEVSIANLSVVTSGVYQRYYEVDGVKYHHIINKDTLMPSNFYTSVTIVTNDSGFADALSTALFNMPLDVAIEFINNLENVEAFFVDNNYNTYQTNGFEQYQK